MNLAVVMLLGGLWHGAKWNFIVWGAYHGLLLGYERWRGKQSLYETFPHPFRIGLTFVLMLFSWVLFRADNLTAAWHYYGAMFGLMPVADTAPLLAATLYTPYRVLVLLVCALLVFQPLLEDASVVARVLRPLFQFAQFTWLRDGGEKALVGRDGWLFYKPGCDDMVARHHPAANSTNDPVAAIVAWRDALAARGIHLLVVPAPNKESVYPDQLTSRMAAGQGVMSPSTRDVLTRLTRANVECVDLFTLFAEARTSTATSRPMPLYLKQDSHWSPAGVALTAKAVAQRLTEIGWAKPGTVEYRERAAPVERLGDVVRMMQSARIERASVPERVPCIQVIRADTGQPYRDHGESEILILGDSFLRIYEQDEPGSAGFIAHLAKELKQPLTSLVNDGGASTLVRQELHRRPSLLKNKQVVVWEFVERDIRLGTEGWQQVPLPPLASADDGSSGREPAPLSQNQSRRTSAVAAE